MAIIRSMWPTALGTSASIPVAATTAWTTFLAAALISLPANQNAVIANNNATNNFIIQPCGGVQIITPSPLPVGEWGVYYDQFIAASACGNNYNWSQTGGNLPGGLNLNQKRRDL